MKINKEHFIHLNKGIFFVKLDKFKHASTIITFINKDLCEWEALRDDDIAGKIFDVNIRIWNFKVRL